MGRWLNVSLITFIVVVLSSCSGGSGSAGGGSKITSGAISVKQQEINNLNSSVVQEQYKLTSGDLDYLQKEGVVSSSKASKLKQFQN